MSESPPDCPPKSPKTSGSLAQGTARPRVVLLGASNLYRALPTAIEAALLQQQDPCDFLIACGNGRSYGQVSQYMGRQLPGIIDSELWTSPLLTCDDSESRPTYAMLTDIGNDVMYGQDPTTIAGWIRDCVERLQNTGNETVMTPLPMGSICKVSRAKYLLFRTILFPSSRFTLSDMLTRVGDLDEQLRHFARASSIATETLRPQWYGLDPIHIRKRSHHEAFATIYQNWQAGKESVGQQPTSTHDDHSSAAPKRFCRQTRRAIRKLKPAQSWRRGKSIQMKQPAMTLPDGSTLSLY